MKGKVVECIYHQCPLLTTTVGVEGLPQEGYEFAVAETDQRMAGQLVSLYRDPVRLAEMVDASSNYINKYFTRNHALDVVEMDINGNSSDTP